MKTDMSRSGGAKSPRTERESRKWIREYRRQQELTRKLQVYAPDILSSERFLTTRTHLQHGDVTVYRHCMNVAMASARLSEDLHLRVREKDMIRGALLHDYFLYDWHEGDPNDPKWIHDRLHGFYHAGKALRNAREEYPLTECEQEIIRRHMWPMNPVPPNCKEAWVVIAADKWVSLKETLHLVKGHGKQRYGVNLPGTAKLHSPRQ